MHSQTTSGALILHASCADPYGMPPAEPPAD